MENEILTWVKETLKTRPLVVFNVSHLKKEGVTKLLNSLNEFKTELNDDLDLIVSKRVASTTFTKENIPF